MAEKEFKTIDEQLLILKSRDLDVPNDEVAKEFLLRNNYYRVSGYSLTLRTNDVFHKDATFQNIIDIYSFDHELRHILLRFIEIIEVTVKSVYAYEFTKCHGPTGHLDASFFTDAAKHKEIIDRAEDQKKRRHRHEAYIKHYVDERKENMPFWAYVDLLTIADISFMIQMTEPTILNAAALDVGLKVNGAELLKKFMKSMTIIRNLCAHGHRLYNRLFEQKPSLNKAEQSLLRNNADGTKDNAHLFGFVLIMRRLLKQEEFAEMVSQLKLTTSQYPFVDMKYYGFPEGWEDILV